jgi:hypothetical protein
MGIINEPNDRSEDIKACHEPAETIQYRKEQASVT